MFAEPERFRCLSRPEIGLLCRPVCRLTIAFPHRFRISNITPEDTPGPFQLSDSFGYTGTAIGAIYARCGKWNDFHDIKDARRAANSSLTENVLASARAYAYAAIVLGISVVVSF
jgi:hypothetical protein